MNVVPSAEGENARESGYGQISQFGNLLLRIHHCIIGPFLTHDMESTEGLKRYGADYYAWSYRTYICRCSS